MSVLLLAVACLGLLFSLTSFIFTSAARPSLEKAHAASLDILSFLSFVFLIAIAAVVFSATALFRREQLGRRKAEGNFDRFRLAAEASPNMIAIMRASGRIEYVNAAVERTTGFPKKDLINKRMKPALPWYGDETVAKRMRETVLAGNEFAERVYGKTKDETPLVFEERVMPFRDEKGNITRMISTSRDLGREMTLEDRIDYLHRFDQLTGLPNRENLLDQLEQTMESAKASGALVSVLIIDIDRFKHVNDVCGAETGDEVLKHIAQRIQSSVSPADIVARTGNDDFTIIHIDGQKPSLGAAIAQKLQAALSRPIAVNGSDMTLTISAGIAVHPDDGGDAWSLLKNADLALARAKAQGRNGVQFYDAEITKRVREFFILEKRLFSALENNEYRLHYQPYCDLRTKKILGAEALIRWKNPELGIVSPAKFIPSLEDTGKVVEVGRWIIETACNQSKEWERKNHHFPVSVNLSLAQFRHHYLVGMVKDTINDFRIDPRRLTLEVTETVFMHDMEFAIKTMKQLKDVGVALSVDDFGTGYSSLSYVKKLPVDNLKIDISFVRDVTWDQNAAAIVNAITTLAQSLKLKTIAEGVETEEQRNILHLLRCDMGQGYLFSPAVDAKEFEKILV